MRNKSVLFAFLFVLPIMAFSQRERNVSGEYTYYLPSNVTLEQARVTAEQRAIYVALVKEFNQTVYGSDLSVLSNKGVDELDDFYSIGVVETRGEWLRDRKPTEFETGVEDGELFVKATVWGVAREIVAAKTMVDAKVLRNGTEPKFESNVFKDGDDLYLYYRAPEDGWLCVFLLNRFSNEDSCLLPYRQSPDGAVQVKHDKSYVFFDADKNQPDWNLVDEYTMTCEDSGEFNEIQVVFSSHKFSKPVSGESIVDDQPLTCDLESWNKWLSKCQTKDKDMVVEKRVIRIDKGDKSSGK